MENDTETRIYMDMELPHPLADIVYINIDTL